MRVLIFDIFGRFVLECPWFENDTLKQSGRKNNGYKKQSVRAIDKINLLLLLLQKKKIYQQAVKKGAHRFPDTHIHICRFERFGNILISCKISNMFLEKNVSNVINGTCLTFVVLAYIWAYLF